MLKYSASKLPHFSWLIFFGFPVLLLVREHFLFFWAVEQTRLLTLSYALLISLILLYKNKNIKAEIPNSILIALSLWLISSLASTFLSPLPIDKFIRWAEISCYLLLVLSAYSYFKTNPIKLNLSLWALASCTFLVLALFTLNWNLLDNPREHPWVHHAPFVVNIRHLGSIICLLLPIGFYTLNTPHKAAKTAGFIYLIISWGLIIWMGGRGSALSAFIVTIIASRLIPAQSPWLNLAPVLGWLLSQLFNVNDPSLNLFRIHLDSLSLFDSLNTNSSSRIELYLKSLNLWWESSPLLGLGANAYSLCKHLLMPDFHHPHNLLIQILLSFGLVGLLSALFLIYKYLRFLLQAPVNNQLIGCSVIAGLCHAQLSGTLYHGFSSLLFCLFLILSLIKQK